MKLCDKMAEDQMVEVGVVRQDWTGLQLQPIQMEWWRRRMKKQRMEELVLSKETVKKLLLEIDKDIERGEMDKIEGNRRAVVFYVDKGKGFLKYLTWWLFTWRKIGLDAVEEAFDIILMTHPSSVPHLPVECSRLPANFSTTVSGVGRCLYQELVGISYRDHRYDSYLNSQECLFNRVASFLEQYKLLMRADLDTFPTPKLIGYWPSDIICYHGAVTSHYRE